MVGIFDRGLWLLQLFRSYVACVRFHGHHGQYAFSSSLDSAGTMIRQQGRKCKTLAREPQASNRVVFAKWTVIRATSFRIGGVETTDLAVRTLQALDV